MKKCNTCNKYISEMENKCPYCDSDLEEVKSTVDFGNIENTSYNDNFDIKVFMKEPKSIMNFIKNPDNKKKVRLIEGAIIGFFIFIVLIFMLLFSSNGGSSTPVMVKVLDEVEEYLSDNYLDNNAVESGRYNLVYKLNDRKREFNGEYARDTKNRILSISGSMNDPNEHMGGVILDAREFNFDLYLKNNELDLYSKEIIDQYISVPINDDTGLLRTKNYDLSSLINGLFEATRETLKKAKYNNDRATINYRGEEVSTKYQYIKLDNNGKRNLYTSFYQNLIDESNFVNEYSRINATTTETTIEKLNNYITTAEYKYSGESELYSTLGVYYNGSKVYRIELDRTNDEENDKLYLDIGDTKYYLYYYQGDKNIYEATLAITDREIAGVPNQTYAITYISDDYDIDINLKLIKDTRPVVKKKEIENLKSIRDLTEEEMNSIYFNESVYTDLNIVRKLVDISYNRCTKDLNCTCEENAEVCSCVYNNDFIQCPIEEVRDI